MRVADLYCGAQVYAQALRLDGPTLANLELLENGDGGAQGSLLARLDTCTSAGMLAPPLRRSSTLLCLGSTSRRTATATGVNCPNPLLGYVSVILSSQERCSRHFILLYCCLSLAAPCPGGRRLLRRWICRPLQDVGAIDRRLDAVENLLQRPDLGGPDLERSLGQAAAAMAPPSAGLPNDLLAAAQRK